jgi:uncharacterized protein YueI
MVVRILFSPTQRVVFEVWRHLKSTEKLISRFTILSRAAQTPNLGFHLHTEKAIHVDRVHCQTGVSTLLEEPQERHYTISIAMFPSVT